MSGEITFDHSSTAPALDSGIHSVPDGPKSQAGSGVDPAISGSVDKENSATSKELDGAKDDGKKTKDASKGLDDADQKNKKGMSGIGTNLGGGSGSGGGSGGGSPSGGGGGAPSGGGGQPPMPPMSPPQQSSPPPSSGGGSPSGGGGGSPSGGSGGGMSMPKDMMQGLLQNYNPDKAKEHNKDAMAVSDGKGIDAAKIDTKDVAFHKTGIGPLTGSQLHATIEKALDLNGVSKDPDVRKHWHEVLSFMAAHESNRNPDAVNTTDCVPIDNAILTKRGWLKYDEVRVGDMTLGYNPDTHCSEWTTVTRVVVYDDAPVTRLSNSRWEAVSTDNHRWLVTRRLSPKVVDSEVDMQASSCSLCSWPEGAPRRGKSTTGGLRIHMAKKHGVKSTVKDTYTEPMFVETHNLTTRDNIILSAPSNTESSLDISLVEAELLGWIAGDGHVETRKYRPTISIAQSKPDQVEHLQTLLSGVPHSAYVDERLTRTGRTACGPRYQFRLNHEWAVDLMSRVGHPKRDALNIVLSMSTAEREAWLEGMVRAEGHVRDGRTGISQCYGAVLDAIIVATYMRGRRPAVLDNNVQTAGWSPSAQVYDNIPRTCVSMLSREPAGRVKVWCVTTELGSWTCRNGEHVFLTGNSNAHGQTVADGHPANCSRGIWQCIPSTFAAHHVAGTSNNIYDPTASAAASVNYIMGRYHVSPNGGASLQAFYASRMKGGYTGY